MNYKKKSLIISLLLIIIIQVILLINNKTKTSFRYFIWNIQEVSIGRLICISFISGLLISSCLNKTLNTDIRKYSKNEEDEKPNNEPDNTIKNEENNRSFEKPPERDVRDTQPTISVNYRVIKDNGENEFNDRNQRSPDIKYKDDWYTNDSEW
tara:strand:+ start:108 stop:566 length:459 start_codon:yes stop_codon:yes gene_type:complete